MKRDVDDHGKNGYEYRRKELVEPDWTRFPGWAGVRSVDWHDVKWQRQNCVKSIRQLATVMGNLLNESFYEDLEKDRQKFATMSTLITPQMLNTMVSETTWTTYGQAAMPAYGDEFTEAFYRDPVRRYMLPVASDRLTTWPSHPLAQRDSLHEKDMWVAEGLVHRYPTKVLAELLSTCPQYCGHCTRMDLVGNSTPQVQKIRLGPQPSLIDGILDYLENTPSVRDVVVSGGDLANLPWKRIENFLERLLAIDSIRDIRLASKGLVGLPQHWLVSDTVAGIERISAKARVRGVSIALHTHANCAQSITPLVAEASRTLLDAGLKDVRNQGVLMRGVNSSVKDLLDLCFALVDEAQITPYYFYMCDMIPNSEHWRVTLGTAQDLQDSIMGYLPGFSTPRIVCDVPFLGKRWVHQCKKYNWTNGISIWGIYADRAEKCENSYAYYDPIDQLPQKGQKWWAENPQSLSNA